jgi:plastocyanin domain-containing protein
MLKIARIGIPLIAIALVSAPRAIAQPEEMPGMPGHTQSQPRGFQKVDQPLPVKAGVVVGGITLIGLELWWFLFSKKKSQTVPSEQENS